MWGAILIFIDVLSNVTDKTPIEKHQLELFMQDTLTFESHFFFFFFADLSKRNTNLYQPWKSRWEGGLLVSVQIV